MSPTPTLSERLSSDPKYLKEDGSIKGLQLQESGGLHVVSGPYYLPLFSC
jgi:hypothetical protein